MAAFSLWLDLAIEVNRHFLENERDDLSFLGSYEDPFAIIGGVCLSACRVSRGLLGGIQ